MQMYWVLLSYHICVQRQSETNSQFVPDCKSPDTWKDHHHNNNNTGSTIYLAKRKQIKYLNRHRPKSIYIGSSKIQDQNSFGDT